MKEDEDMKKAHDLSKKADKKLLLGLLPKRLALRQKWLQRFLDRVPEGSIQRKNAL